MSREFGRLSVTPVDDLHIDVATRQDIALIVSLIRAFADYERLADQIVATEESLYESLFGRRPAIEAVIARTGTVAVGYSAWFESYSTFLGKPGLYLEDLFVLPAWRGRGIGRALLRHLGRIAIERGCGRMEWSVLDWNEPAIGFYRSIGARPMDEWTVYRLTGDALHRVAQ